MMRTRQTVMIALLLVSTAALGQPDPWLPNARCAVAPRGTRGLLPAAMRALETVGVAHRITRTLDLAPGGVNYHGPDVTLSNGRFTAAVDVSVRCLGEDDIRRLLGRLAGAGFAAWYRASGKDGWTGANHIHAVWAAEPLKPQLRAQIHSWIAGRTGLTGDAEYGFWQPTEAERRAVESAYARSQAGGTTSLSGGF